MIVRLPSVSLLCLRGWQEDNIRTSIRQFCDGERREDEAATAPSETSGQLAESVEAVLANMAAENPKLAALLDSKREGSVSLLES